MAEEDDGEGEAMLEEPKEEPPPSLPVMFQLTKPGTLLLALQVSAVVDFVDRGSGVGREGESSLFDGGWALAGSSRSGHILMMSCR